MTAPIAAIVLAGGRSSRFGRDKLEETVDDRPLLEHAIRAVQTVASAVVVVAAPGATPILPVGVHLAHDREAFRGPLAGLAAGLAALDPSVERVVVVAGDMPTLVPAVLRRLIDALGSSADVAVLGVDGDSVPLPMAVQAPVTGPATRRLLDRGERRLRALPEELRTRIVPEATWRLDDPDRRTLRDVDVPSDL
jgi:molybdopterin-guanine dinucleotide biosynthesis protein A